MATLPESLVDTSGTSDTKHPTRMQSGATLQVHNVAMLLIDGQLPPGSEARDALVRYTVDRLRAACILG